MPRPLKEQPAKAMYEMYQEGYSLAEVGQRWGLTRQSVYDAFHRRGWPLRSQVRLSTVTFEGETYSPDPDGYYRKTSGDRRWLAHVVWEHHNGPIPAGYEIHHRDRNKANNAISNLACLTPLEHGREHKPYHDLPDRPCLFCGEFLVRKRQPSGRLETPAEVLRRRYCDTSCQSAHRRGKPAGWGPCREEAAAG